MSKILISICAILVSACFGKSDEVLSNSVEEARDYFPEGYFLEVPRFDVTDDTLCFTLVVKYRDWHKAHYQALGSRIWQYVPEFKSIKTVQNSTENGIKFTVYNSEKIEDFRADFYSKGPDLQNSWRDSTYVNLNFMILETDPYNLFVMDQIIGQYSEESDSDMFDLDVLELYMAASGGRKLKKSDLIVMDSIVSSALINHEYIDTTFVKKFDEYINRMYEKLPKELIIEDQIPDHLKERDE